MTDTSTPGGPRWPVVAERVVAAVLAVWSVAVVGMLDSGTGVDLGVPPVEQRTALLLPPALVACAALWWRRSRPLTVTAVVVTAFVVLKVLRAPQSPADLAVFFALDGVGAYAARRSVLPAALAASVAVLLPVVAVPGRLVLLEPWQRIAIVPAAVLILVVAPLAVGLLRRRTRERIAALEATAARPVPVPAAEPVHPEPVHPEPDPEPTPDPALDRLTPREREVLALISVGLTNAEIAARLTVTVDTVKTHVTRVLAKTGARHRTEAALLAQRAGLTRQDGEHPTNG